MMCDLIGNVTLEIAFSPGGQEKRVYKVQVKGFSRDNFFVIQDLVVKELEKGRMQLAESQIWQRLKHWMVGRGRNCDLGAWYEANERVECR